MADVTSTFAAKDIGFTSTVNRMQKSLAGFQSNLGGFATKLAGLAAAFVGVQQSVAAFNSALAMGGRLDDLSKTTGASAGELLLLEKAFALAGSSADAVGPAIARLSRFMVEASTGGTAQIETMNKLGLSYAQLKNLTPTEQMRMLAKSIMALPTPAERTAAAMDIFGRSGSTLIPLFANFSGELEKAQGYLGSLPGLLDESAGAMADMEDDLGALGDKFTQFVAGLVAGAAGADNFASALAKIDTAGIGAGLGEELRVAFDAPLATSKAIGYVLLTGAKEAGNTLINAAAFAGEMWVKTVSGKDYIAGLGKRLEGAVLVAGYGFIRVMQEGIERVYKLLAQLPGPLGIAARNDLKDIEAWQGRLNARIKEGQDALAEGARLIKGSIDDAKNSTEILSKDWLGVEQSAADAARHIMDAQDQSRQIREDSEATAANYAKGSAAIRDALNGIRGFDLKDQMGPEQRPDFTQSDQPPPKSTPAPSGGGGGSARSSAPSRPKTAEDYETEMRAAATAGRFSERARSLQERGHFDAAGRAMEKADRAAQGVRDKANVDKFLMDQYGAGTMGEAFEKYRDMTGIGRDSREDFERKSKEKANGVEASMRDQTKTPEERTREEKESGGGRGAGHDPVLSAVNAIEKFLSKTFFDDFKKRLPQNALS
jgi:hypothetical protein